MRADDDEAKELVDMFNNQFWVGIVRSDAIPVRGLTLAQVDAIGIVATKALQDVLEAGRPQS